MTEQSSFHEAVRELAGAVIAERRSALGAAGLRATVEVKWWSDDDGENSELRVAFWRENAFIDVVEDLIVHDGVPVASLAELRQWLEHGVDAVLEENRSR